MDTLSAMERMKLIDELVDLNRPGWGERLRQVMMQGPFAAKGDNAILPLFTDDGDLTCLAGAAVAGGTFVNALTGFTSGPLLNAAAPATDGGNLKVTPTLAGLAAVGVAAYDAPTANVDKFHCYSRPGTIVPMIAGANITAGLQCEANASSLPINHASGIVLGTCLHTALSGALTWIKLVL